MTSSDIFYIDTDGKTVLRWATVIDLTHIRLEDGRVLQERDYLDRSFGTHPRVNPNVRRDGDGVYHWDPVPSDIGHHGMGRVRKAHSFKTDPEPPLLCPCPEGQETA